MEGGGWRVGGGAYLFVACLSRLTIDHTSPQCRNGTSGFHRPSGHGLYQARSVVMCSASRMKGELHPAGTACEADLHMDNSFNELIYLPV